MASSLHAHYPWTSPPFVANAPMAGFAYARLATAVSSAGGLGFIGAANDMEILKTQVEEATSILAKTDEMRDRNVEDSTLPIGIGFLIFIAKLEEVVKVIRKFHPAAIWLSCPGKTEDFGIWAKELREVSPHSHIWIQVSSVATALEVARLSKPDVLVMQSSDAGGHGGFPGSGLVSLVPETRDALDNAGFQSIPVLASGGISDGRGVAAALAAGAEGVVIGTRFLASEEVDMPAKEYLEAILEATDGGVTTARSTMFDDVKGPSFWPAGYDGRALAGASYKEHLAGSGIEEIRQKYKEAEKGQDKGFGGERRAPIWAGAGLGLVKEVKSARDIVWEMRKEAKSALEKAAARLEGSRDV